jgi:hypothetical protein
MLTVISMDRHPQPQYHHRAKRSRNLSFDEPDEAPAGTRCVADYSIQRMSRSPECPPT